MPTIINGTDDTAATPALTGADTDTGVFFPAANTMAFSTGGTEKMRVTSAGNVGIGTSSPTSSLVVAGEAAGTPTVDGVHLGKQGGYAVIELVGTSGTGSVIDFTQSGTDMKGRIIYDNTNNYMGLWANATERMRIDSNGLLQFNSGYGSVATAYGCRAWVNFDGTGASNLTGTYSQTGTTVTVTITAHGYITGSSAYLDFTSGTAVDGAYTVTVTDANTFTVTQASRTTSGNVTSRRNTIRGSGNVSSVSDNATGDYTINFTNAMPDANIATIATSVNTTFAVSVAQTTTTTQIRTNTVTPTLTDASIVNVAVFR